ncbi:MAG TPA: peptidoglycan-binding protein [Acidimicrobiales bacterium]|nr:peptidoglycan-binding protein [Acidimicrobiales bacterium]
MSTATSATTVGAVVGGDPAPRRPGHRRHRRALVLGLVVVAAVGTAVGVVDPFGPGRPGATGVQDNAYPTSLATVTRRSLSSQTDEDGTLGYAGSYAVIGQGQGTVTAFPAPGQVVTEGQALFSADGSPVLLLYGAVPAYRTLSAGLAGADVAQLNADLVALGDATRTELDPASTTFTAATTAAVKRLQAGAGLSQTGTLTLGQAVFLPSAVRVTTVSATLGGSAAGPILQGTSTSPEVTVDVDSSLQSDVAAGDQVEITLPNGRSTPGVISSVGTVATSSSSGSSPTVTVEVTPTDAAATDGLDQAPVEVLITTGSVTGALVVPVDALVALAGGGYALEVVDAAGVHRLVPVSPGLFDAADNLVQVTGAGLAPGQRVVVPNP